MTQKQHQNYVGERWKDIPGYEGYYKISDFGRVKSLQRKVPFKGRTLTVRARVRKLQYDSDGYIILVLSKHNSTKTIKVHRVVATVFKTNKRNLPIVNHLDGNKSNNYYKNLQWATESDNQQHALELGLRTSFSNSKFSAADIAYIRNSVKGGVKQKQIAKEFKTTPSTICYIVNYKTFKRV